MNDASTRPGHSDHRTPTARGAEGRIDAVADATVSGWIDATALPSVWIDGECVGRLKPAHLAEAVPSPSGERRRFAFPAHDLGIASLLGETLQIELRDGDDADRVIARRTCPVSGFFALPPSEKAPDGAFSGCIDEYSRSRLRGWVRNAARPDEPIAIWVFLGRRYIGQYLARDFRPDLASVGMGDGRAGFDIDISRFTAVSGLRRRLVVVAGASGWRIPLGPHACPSRLDRLTAALRRRAGKIDLPLSVEAFARRMFETPRYPKKVFDIASVPGQKMPDPHSAEYTLLAIEFLRREAADLAEARQTENLGFWERRRRVRALGQQMRNLVELGQMVAASQAILRNGEPKADLEPRGRS